MSPVEVFLLALQAMGAGLWLASLAYLSLALYRVTTWRPERVSGAWPCPPVTILKPLCGAEPGLEANLRMVCEQVYPAALQIVFGVATAADAALPLVRRLAGEYPHRDIAVVVNDASIGPNPKVSNLANMAAAAKYDLWAISDSDAAIGAAVVRRTAPLLNDPTVGAVTCLYRGVPADPGRAADQLGALYANGWTLPSNVVAGSLGGLESCDGPMTLIRRQVIEAEGGFAHLSHILGDDHELGAMTVRQGLRVLQGPVVDTVFDEPSLGALLSHELRWARTTRAATPVAYAASVVTWSLPLTVLLLITNPLLAAVAGAIQIGLRMALIALTRLRLQPAKGSPMPAPWTVAARECLCFAVWAGGWFGRHVAWRGQRFAFGPGGVLAPVEVAAGRPARLRRAA